MQAKNRLFEIEVNGTASSWGTYVRTPTEKGMAFCCRDTTHGKLHLQLREFLGRNVEINGNQRSKIILEAQSSLAGVEAGGGPGDEVWRAN